MTTPRRVIAKVIVEVEAEVLLDRDGNCEEVLEVKEVIEPIEVVSVQTVLSEF